MHALEEKNALTQELEKTRKILEDSQCEKVGSVFDICVCSATFKWSVSFLFVGGYYEGVE